jgi:hypothetical protein
VATVLIELPGGEGIVRRDDGEIALTHDVSLDWGQPLQPWDRYQPIRLGLSDDRMPFGGLLPPGAVSAEAVEATGVRKAAAVGGGTYAVIFEDGEPGEPNRDSLDLRRRTLSFPSLMPVVRRFPENGTSRESLPARLRASDRRREVRRRHPVDAPPGVTAGSQGSGMQMAGV